MKFLADVDNGPMNKRLNFGGDPVTDTDPDPQRDTGIRHALAKIALSQCF